MRVERNLVAALDVTGRVGIVLKDGFPMPSVTADADFKAARVSLSDFYASRGRIELLASPHPFGMTDEHHPVNRRFDG